MGGCAMDNSERLKFLKTLKVSYRISYDSSFGANYEFYR